MTANMAVLASDEEVAYAVFSLIDHAGAGAISEAALAQAPWDSLGV